MTGEQLTEYDAVLSDTVHYTIADVLAWLRDRGFKASGSAVYRDRAALLRKPGAQGQAVEGILRVKARQLTAAIHRTICTVLGVDVPPE